MGCFHLYRTELADEDVIAECGGATDKHFQDIDNDAGTELPPVGDSKTPPVAIVEKDISDFDMTADEFHKGTIVNLNVD